MRSDYNVFFRIIIPFENYCKEIYFFRVHSQDFGVMHNRSSYRFKDLYIICTL